MMHFLPTTENITVITRNTHIVRSCCGEIGHSEGWLTEVSSDSVDNDFLQMHQEAFDLWADDGKAPAVEAHFADVTKKRRVNVWPPLWNSSEKDRP